MKVCLIIPPSGFLLDERVFPVLGILKVAAALEQHGIPVTVIDLSGHRVEDWCVAEDLQQFRAIGITATMPQMPSAVEIAKICRRAAPNAKLILGGPHPTLLHASAKLEKDKPVKRATQAFKQLTDLFDVVVCGDGEKTIEMALSAVGPCTIDADNPTTSMFLTKADLETAPLPARHLIDLPSYRYKIDGHKTASLIAQLGCPFGCNFCGGRRSPFLRRVRLRSTGAVIAELRHLYETHGYTGFMFLDDELNVNPSYMELLGGILELQAKLKVEFRLRGLLKSELVTQPMAHRMYQAGFRQVLVGFESGSPRMLLNMNKHATRDDNSRCVNFLHEANISVKALMSFGHPGESYETVDATRDWLLEVQPEDFDVTIITVYPGTPYYDDAQPMTGGDWVYTAHNGDKLYQKPVDHLKDVNFYKGIPGAYQSFVWTEYLSQETLVSCRDDVEKDVRTTLAIPWPRTSAEMHLEHSMGM